MSVSGFLIILLGLLAELPQGIASLHGLPVGSPSGALPGSPLMQNSVVLGCLLNCGGLSLIARAKGLSWAPALLGLLAIPGALIGLTAILLLKSHPTAGTQDVISHGY